MKSDGIESTDAGCLAKGFVAGLAGGLAGSAAMDLFQKAWSVFVGEQIGEQASDEEPGKHMEQRGGERRQQHDESGEQPATVKTAEAISTRIFHHELSEAEKKVAGPAVHYRPCITPAAR